MARPKEPLKAHRVRQQRLAEMVQHRAVAFFGVTLEDAHRSGPSVPWAWGAAPDEQPEYIEVASRGALYRITVEVFRAEGEQP